MKVEILLRTEGQPAAVVGDAEGDTWPEMQQELPAALRSLADEIEKRDANAEVPDAAPR